MNYFILILLYLVLGLCYTEFYVREDNQKIPWYLYIPIVVCWPLTLWIALLVDIFGWIWTKKLKK